MEAGAWRRGAGIWYSGEGRMRLLGALRMDTICTLSKKKKITNRVLLVLMASLVVMMVYDLIVRNQYFFLIVEIMMLGASIDYTWRNIAAFSCVTFGASGMDLTRQEFFRREKRVSIPYDAIQALAEIKNGFVAIETGEKERFIIHGEHNTSMAHGAPERTTNVLREEILARSGKEITIRYL